MSAVEETAAAPDGPVEVIQVLFALHQGFGAQELCGPLEVLSNALQKIGDPGISLSRKLHPLFLHTIPFTNLPLFPPQKVKPLNAPSPPLPPP